jgi:uncharacterized membrane protein YdjX (TVP38/TMEM64 family)
MTKVQLPNGSGREPGVSPTLRGVLIGRVIPALVVLGVFGWLAFGPGPSAAWDVVRTNLDAWQIWANRHPAPALLAFFAGAVVATTLPLPIPVTGVVTLLAGALFGRPVGVAAASLAYTIGVTTAFLAARWLLRDWVRRHAGHRLRGVERGFARDGAFYLLALRLIPTVPFFLVNVLMAVTPIRTRTFVLVSWAGVLPAMILYAGVGTELGALRSPADALSPGVVASLAALAVLPLAARMVLRWLRPPVTCRP